MSAPYILITTSAVWIILKSKYEFSNFVISKIILAVLGPLHFHMNFILFFTYFFRCTVAYRILVPWPAMKPGQQQWKCWVLTPGSPGNSLNFRISLSISSKKAAWIFDVYCWDVKNVKSSDPWTVGYCHFFSSFNFFQQCLAVLWLSVYSFWW